MNHPSLDKVISKLTEHGLDLSGQIVSVDQASKACGGFCDVTVGHCQTINKKVAIKKLRVHLSKDIRFAKVSRHSIAYSYRHTQAHNVLETCKRSVYLVEARSSACVASCRFLPGGWRIPESRFRMDGERNINKLLEAFEQRSRNNLNGTSNKKYKYSDGCFQAECTD